MRCAWKELLGILPGWIGGYTDKVGRDRLRELRLRLGKPPELVMDTGSQWMTQKTNRDDLNFCVNAASRYSPWAAQSIARGFITASGGHRIGICGEAVVKNAAVMGIREIDSLCIRVARDYPGIGEKAARLSGNLLLLGPPGSGKTTLLRDIARNISYRDPVGVVDERSELFPPGFDTGEKLDVLKGCTKVLGVDMLLRTMTPAVIAVDEITAEEDCEALIRAGWCGVRLLATAHAASVMDLQCRPVYRSLVSTKLFDHILVLSRDKSWRAERMD